MEKTDKGTPAGPGNEVKSTERHQARGKKKSIGLKPIYCREQKQNVNTVLVLCLEGN